MLQRLAAGDLYACRRLADDADVADHIVGFLAQQAVEKAFKVALVLTDLELPRTHDIELLVEQVENTGQELPDELLDSGWLTPWAAELRYDVPVALDRAAAEKVAETAVRWSGSILSERFNAASGGGGSKSDGE
jgi:HEPN domain-containing protein